MRREEKRLIVSEVKFKVLSKAERAKLEKETTAKWQSTELGRQQAEARVEVLNAAILGKEV